MTALVRGSNADVAHALRPVGTKTLSAGGRRSRLQDQRRIRGRCPKLRGAWRGTARQGKRSAGRADRLGSRALSTQPGPGRHVSLDAPHVCRAYDRLPPVKVCQKSKTVPGSSFNSLTGIFPERRVSNLHLRALHEGYPILYFGSTI